MSAVPPSGSVPDALPWENRSQVGVVRAYIDTVTQFLTNPDVAWSRTRENGGLEDPLLFGMASAVVGSLFRAVYGLMFAPVWMRFIPFAIRNRWLAGWPHRATGCALVLWPIATAIGVTIGLFIASAIFHLCLMLVGGLKNSTSRFEGTFRTVSYSSVSMLAHVVPFMGGLIAFVWGFYLALRGAVRMHRTTTGRAAAAMLIPLAVVILLLLAVLAVMVGLLMATRSSASP
jgi:hypothetical protein